jgi:hypothetical protein
MYRPLVFALVAGILAVSLSGASASAEQCRMEQQCKWKNFKKICIWVRVCR